MVNLPSVDSTIQLITAHTLLCSNYLKAPVTDTLIMKATSAFSLLALAFATTVVAIPTPGVPAGPSALGLGNIYAPGSSDVIHDEDGSIDKRGMMFGPKKMMMGMNGAKRNADDNDITVDAADAEEVEKRGMMFGPKKMMMGMNGAKRDADEFEAPDTDEIEKRGMIFGPKKMMMGMNGAKRDSNEADDAETENVEKRGMIFGPKKMMMGMNGA